MVGNEVAVSPEAPLSTANKDRPWSVVAVTRMSDATLPSST